MASPNKLKKIKSLHLNDGSVAIVMRTKNRNILLSRAFASVLSQTYSNWHLCLVNDGGDRNAVEKMVARNKDAFREKITVIHHETSRGMEAASNSALKQTKGEFLIVHDDDDSWKPEFLEKTVGFLNDPQNSAYLAVVTNVLVIHEKIVGDSVIELDRQGFSNWPPFVDFSHMLFRIASMPISTLMRRSVVNEVGEFNDQLPVMGDWDYALRILAKGDIGTILEPLAYYHLRINDMNSSYGNSVIAGRVSIQEKSNVLLRNRNLRRAFNAYPEMMGLVQAITYPMNETQEALKVNIDRQFEVLNRRMDRLETVLLDVQQLLHKFLGPARWAYGLTRPFRKLIAKFSNRT